MCSDVVTGYFYMGLFQAIKAAISGKRGPESSGAHVAPGSRGDSTPDGDDKAAIVSPRKLLLVEADPAVRAQMAACLEGLSTSWPSQIVSTAEEALKALTSERYDGIVTSARLGETPGVDFLEQAAAVAPDLVRFLVATPEDRTELTKRPGLPPHFLTTPPNPVEWAELLERGFLLMRWMSGAPVRTLLSRMTNLPAVPSLYARVMRELRSDDPSIEAVGKLIAQDPALTAKILQMVNSPVFALGRPICEAVDAVTFLGAERTKALILMASLSLHGSLTPCDGFSQESFWQHSLAVATMGRLLALKEIKNASLADACFTAGLLHDIGKLLFASNLPREYGEVIAAAKRDGLDLHQAELAAFGVSHGQLGASLLGTWGLPIPVLEAIAWHEHPVATDAPGFSSVTVVHAANILEYEKRGGGDQDRTPQFELPYLEAVGLEDRTNHWRSLCGCAPRSEPAAKAA